MPQPAGVRLIDPPLWPAPLAKNKSRKFAEVNDDWLKLLKEQWLPQVEAGTLDATELAEQILRQQYAAGTAFQADIDRRRRCGLGEVIYGPGKSAELISSIAAKLFEADETEVLVTRVEADVARTVCSRWPCSRYDLLGRTLRLRLDAFQPIDRVRTKVTAEVGVVCAGSTDLPVAREAMETLHWMDIAAYLIVDVGVAGPYRLLPHLERMRRSVALVVIAGMEGALASVVGGLVPCPVVAVPTSVGYGANLQGVTTLLSMLSSCAAGVTVVNIDAGFKAAYVAGLIARQSNR